MLPVDNQISKRVIPWFSVRHLRETYSPNVKLTDDEERAKNAQLGTFG